MKKYFLHIAITALTFPVYAGMGLLEIPKNNDSGLITLFYPISQINQKSSIIKRDGFEFEAVESSTIEKIDKTNGRLIVISHGSPASPWVYLDLTKLLVSNGFVVAIPEHEGDNHKDNSDSGIESWKKRPLEISKAITRLSKDDLLNKKIDFNNIGMYGMSAGGHTALSLAGGKWSPAKLLNHCEKNIAEDFHTCAGPFISPSDGMWGDVKNATIQFILRNKLSDSTWYTHTDNRIQSILSGVPFAVDFDLASLSKLNVKLGIISAKQDIWLKPHYHSNAVIESCKQCTVFEIENGSHGALLSPLPSIASNDIYQLIKDPPNFDRNKEVDKINHWIVNFFIETLNVK